MVLADTDLAVLIIEVVQEGLQQLVRIVDPLRILAYIRKYQINKLFEKGYCIHPYREV